MPEPTTHSAERIPTVVFADASQVDRAVAGEIATLVRAKAQAGERCVLGLATGSTPTGVYEELVRMHRDEALSFANAVTFNLDEYFPMQPNSVQSYRRFRHEPRFARIAIPASNVHIPDGTIPAPQVNEYCQEYE